LQIGYAIFIRYGSLAGLPGISVPCGKIWGNAWGAAEIFGPAFGEEGFGAAVGDAFESGGGAAPFRE